VGGVVDWGLAERTASAVIAGLPGRGAPPDHPYMAAEVAAASQDAIVTAASYAGLGEVASPPVAELLDQRAWAANALVSLAGASAPLERSLADDIKLPGPLGGLVRRAVGAALGAEVGVAAGYAARRVLGQYDLAIVGAPRPARLLYVGPNLDRARTELGADRDLFLRWLALHETTHVIQFDRVGWLAPHLRELAGALIADAAEGVDAGAVAAIGRRALREPRELVRSVLRGELARTLARPEQRERLDRLQATMSVIEGHAEHVMDACVADDDGGLVELRERLDRRRARRGGLGELIARLLGMDLKLRQYGQGKAFCDAIVAAGGEDALRLLWSEPQALPGPAELVSPPEWLRRVAPARV
jgi:coenzyme F420 biosynthesis associated uncharacterized protein